MTCIECQKRKTTTHLVINFYCLDCCVFQIKQLRTMGREIQERELAFFASKQGTPSRESILKGLKQ